MMVAMEETAAENKTGGYGKRPMWQWFLIYAVIGVVVYGAIYYLFLGKKGGYNSNQTQYGAQPTTAANPTTSQQAMSAEMTVPLAQENKSGESGTATLKEANGQVTVTITLTGYAKDVAQPAHIHAGSCPGVGAVKYPLTSVVNGKSTTVLQVTLDQLKAQLPLAVNVHKSAKEASVYTACGPLSAK